MIREKGQGVEEAGKRGEMRKGEAWWGEEVGKGWGGEGRGERRQNYSSK